eukprot:jgi/Tetstr1/464895/TSEL_009632.t1
MDNTMNNKSGVRHQVFRARFSAISAPEIKAAMSMLVEPTRNKSDSVETRQELDKKEGPGRERSPMARPGPTASSRLLTTATSFPGGLLSVAFTRHQTPYFQGKDGNLDANAGLSTGAPRPVRLYVSKGGDALMLEWGRGCVYDVEVAGMFQKLVTMDNTMNNKSGVRHQVFRRREAAHAELPQLPAHRVERMHFAFHEILAEHRRHPIWVTGLLATPLSPSKAELGDSDERRLCEYVSRRFPDSLSPDAVLCKVKVTLAVAGETFPAAATMHACVTTLHPDFTAAMPWRAS